jgi:hypothetical protein
VQRRRGEGDGAEAAEVPDLRSEREVAGGTEAEGVRIIAMKAALVTLMLVLCVRWSGWRSAATANAVSSAIHSSCVPVGRKAPTTAAATATTAPAVPTART